MTQVIVLSCLPSVIHTGSLHTLSLFSSYKIPSPLFLQPGSGVFCPAGLIQVWILLLEQLTAAVSNCPRQHQPPTLELLFALLREVTTVPGNTHTDAHGCEKAPEICLAKFTRVVLPKAGGSGNGVGRGCEHSLTGASTASGLTTAVHKVVD